MCRGISYRRWSNPSQSEGDSQRRQEEGYLRFCKEHQLTPSTLSYVDAGVSGWTGDNLEGSLGAILQAIRDGAIKPKDCIVVEQLDRLGRTELDIALSLFGRILRSGVNIGHVRKNRVLTAADLRGFSVIEFVTEMILANEESNKKSERVRAAMGRNKDRARAGRVWTSKGPAWLKLVEGKWVALPEEVKKIKLIFKLSIGGLGVEAILKRLVSEKVPPLPKSRKWNRNYILSILRDKTVLGFYQPTNKTGKNSRRPAGDPIPNYYLPVIDEATFYDAQTAIDDRARIAGRRGQHVNLLSGLVVDRVSGSTCYVAWRAGGRVLYPSDATSGETPWWSVKLDWLEQVVLRSVSEIRLEGEQSEERDQLAGLKNKRDSLRAKLQKTEQRAGDADDYEMFLGVVANLTKQLRAVEQEIEQLEASLASRPEDVLSETRGAIAALRENPADLNLRLSVRVKLRELVERIEVSQRERGVVLVAILYRGEKKTRTCVLDTSSKRFCLIWSFSDGERIDVEKEERWIDL